MGAKIATPAPAGRRPVAHRYTRRWAWATLFFWGVIVGILAIPAYQFTGRIQSTLSGMKGAPSETVRINIVKNFSTALAFPTAIVWDAKGLPTDQADAAWKNVLDTVRADSNVNDVMDGQTLVQDWPRADWHAAFVAVKATTYGEAQKVIPHLREDVRGLTYPENRKPWVTGGPALFLDLNIASTEALHSGEIIALPITFIILVLVFRSLVAAFIPVLVAIIGVVCTLGTLSYFANYMSITFFVPNLVTMIGLGVGIDYSLIYLARYRREHANHLTTQEALRLTRHTAGKTVLASAILVMSGFISLLLIPLEFFTSIAVGGVLVVAFVALATLTLLPALIYLVGPRLEWGSVLCQPLQKYCSGPRFFEKWGRFVVDRPKSCLALGLVILAVLCIPAFHLRIASVEARNLPPESDSRLGYESLNENLGAGWMMPAIILVQHPNDSWLSGDGMAKEKVIIDQISGLLNTAKVVSVADASGTNRSRQTRMGLLTSYSDQTQSVILALSKSDPQSRAARHWLKEIDGLLRENEKTQTDGTHYFLGGLPSVTLSADNIIIKMLPKIILTTLVSTFILLLIFMRSLLVAIKAILLNLLCVLAAYGFQVFCFQDGWGHATLHTFATDGLNTVVLVICFCALFGLSMDYEVFILSAVRESWLDQHNIRLAVQEGLLRVAGIITSAAIIMVSVFLSFGFGDVVEIEQLGVGLSFAVLLDATVIRLLLVPAIMVLMGRWAFWLPGRPPPTAGRHDRSHQHGKEHITPPDDTNRIAGI